MEQKGRIVFQYSLPAILTLLVVSIVLGIKQIFPFGSNTIDYYDMGQQIAAFYYHVYDALHGEKSLFFDWYSALGTNMTMNTSGCSSISLFNLLLFLFPRDMILQALSVFTMIKMACMSTTMYYFLHKRIKAEYLWQLCFSVGYGISGYVLMLYITNQWLDVAVLFPLLIEGVYRLLKERKSTMYTIVLSLCLMGSYYQSFMILMFVVLAVGLYFVFLSEVDRQERGSVLWQLALATFISLGLASFILIPQLIQTFGSTRFSNNANEGNFYLNILKQVKGAYATRWWTLLGLSLPFSTIVYGMITDVRKKIDRRYLKFTLGLIFIVCAELFVESINLMLHFGSYVGYPIRNGFILSFVVLAVACYYAKDLPAHIHNQENRKELLRYLCGMLFTLVAAGTFICFYRQNSGMSLRQMLHLTFLICALTFFLDSFLLYKKCSQYAVFVLFAEFLIFSYIQLGQPTYITGYSEKAEQSSSYIEVGNELVDELQISSSVTERLKNPDTQLNANYPFIVRRAALSNWTHMVPPEFQQGAAEWGYTIQYTRVLDAGGTVFSDALLGETEALSMMKQPEELYSPLRSEAVEQDGESYEYTLYQNQYQMPFGIVVSDLDENQKAENTTPFDLQNEVYHLLEPEQEKGLIEIVAEGEANHQVIAIEGKKAVYFAGSVWDSDSENMTILVNGKEVDVPTIGEPHNTGYPSYFNNNMLLLGVFQDEEVTIDVKYTEGSSLAESNMSKKYTIGALDLNVLRELCDDYAAFNSVNDISVEKSSMTLTANAIGEQKFALLPIGWDKGFTVQCNGKEVESSRAFGIFTAIPVEEGENRIEINFFPVGMKTGIIISMLSLFLLNAIRLISLRKGVKGVAGVPSFYRFADIIYFSVWCIMVLVIYIIPILFIPISFLI